MKKQCMALLAAACLLTGGCQQSRPAQRADHKEETAKETSALVMKKWRNMEVGAGSEEGYYTIRRQEDQPYSNLFYYDYASGQELYLCSKAQCRHDGEECTSYYPGGSFQLAVHGAYLYSIEYYGYRINTLGERMERGYSVLQMKLDGSEKRVLYEAGEGQKIDAGNLVFDDGFLYLVLAQTKEDEPEEINSSADTKRWLERIDIQSGKAEKVLELKEQSIAGVKDRSILLEKVLYEKKEAEADEQVPRNYQIAYELYDIDSGKTQPISSGLEKKEPFICKERALYHDGSLYFQEEGKLYRLPIESGKQEEVGVLTQSNISLLDVIDDHLLLNVWEEGEPKGILAFSLKERRGKLLPYLTREPKEIAAILAQTEEELLVRYDHIGHEELSWADTLQYDIEKEMIGLVSKKDFLAGDPAYRTIRLLER